MAPIVAPLVPYLAEEVNEILNLQFPSTQTSFFVGGWKSTVGIFRGLHYH
jgi:hypothetical protein